MIGLSYTYDVYYMSIIYSIMSMRFTHRPMTFYMLYFRFCSGISLKEDACSIKKFPRVLTAATFNVHYKMVIIPFLPIILYIINRIQRRFEK